MEKKHVEVGLLSVVVPVYKVEAYLNRCVESIVNQTYTKLEIILVDDGSPDRCPELCDEWAKRDSRIRVIHKENGGLSDARNTGIAAATGEYLAFVDSDDYVGFQMYETMIDAMKRTGVGIACCGRYVVKDGKEQIVHNMDHEYIFTSMEAVRELLIGGCVEESVCDKVYRRDLFQGLCFPVGEINEDIVIMPELLDRSQGVVHVAKPFYYYWQEGTSITRGVYSPNKRVILRHLDAIENYLHRVYPELLDDFAALEARYCQSVLYLLLNDSHVRKCYREDYRKFYARFRRAFPRQLKLVSMEKNEKIKGYLIFWGLYYHLHLIKKYRNRR